MSQTIIRNDRDLESGRYRETRQTV
jgi:hypothetical protein